MADTIKYVSSENLKYYDGKIKSYLEGKDAALKADLEGQLEVVAGALDAEILRAKGEEGKNATAAQNAQAKGEEALAHSEALAEKVGAVPTDKTVMEYIDEKTANIASEDTVNALAERVTQAETDIDNIEKDYLKAADKQELEGKINLKADQTALDEVSEVANAAVKQADYDVKVKALEDEDARIAGLVATEAQTARDAEKANADAIKAISDDYLTSEDKEELQGNIDEVSEALELLTNGVSAEEVDGVNDLIQYVKDHGTEVTGIKADIKANADAIAEHAKVNHDFAAADTALKNELNGEIAKKANQTALDEAVEALEGADEAQIERISALEQKVGSSNVAGDIAAAEQRAKDAAAEDATQKANAAEANAKSHADGLNTAMNTRVEALEAIDHEHANKALLDTYTQTEVNLADAVAKKHEHGNKDVLDGITAGKVSAWDAAEQNAKNHADGLNSAMTTRVDGVVETLGTKAAASDLTALAGRVTTEEGKSANFETRIAAAEEFIGSVEFLTESEINAMFS